MKYHIKKPTPQKPSETASAQAALPMSVFISYAHAQSAVVQDIMAGLRARGHKVWFDAKDIAHGDDWRREITDGLLKSNGVLSFLSREAIRENGVCLDELGIAVGVKYGNIRTVLLQKEKDLQPIPSQLTHRQWLDMSDWQEKKAQGEESYQQWLQGKLALIVEMIESAESREFVGEIETIRKKLHIDDTAISRQGWYLTQPFVGRGWLTEKLEKWLDDPQGGHLCAVYGGPGTGKSAFAAQYVYRSPRVAGSLFFEHGNSYFNSADAIVRELIFQLACRLPEYRSLLLYRLNSLSNAQSLNTQELFEQLLAYPLRSGVKGDYETLCIVIDGLDECDEESRQTAARLLSEERFPAWLRVAVLSRPENTVTANLKPDLELRLDEDEAANRADIRAYYTLRLAEKLEGQADKERLLDQLARRADGVFLYAYIVSDMILHDKLRITDTAAYPQSLNASFEAWFSRYFPDREEFDRRYKLPLGIIAVCREPVPVEELDRIHGRYDREEGCFQLAEADKNRRYQSAVKQLERCALLLKYGQNDFGKTTVAFTHRYITEWLTRTDAATGQSASRDYFCDPADLHWVLSRAWRNRLEAGTPLTEYQALHLLEAMQGAGEPEEVIREVDADEAWGKLLAEKLDACDREGRWKQSFLFAQAQLDRCLCAFGAEHPDTLTALNNLANAHHHLGRYQLALTLHERVCADRKRILGPEHPATLVAMSNLGVSYSNLGRYQDALSLDEQAYEISRRVLGEDHPDTLTYMNNLAQIHFHLGHAQQALLLQEINFEVRRRALGEDDPDTLTAMNNLALTYSALGRYQDALPLDGQLYEIRKRLLGPDHPDTLQSLKNLSYDCYQLGEYEKCVPLDAEIVRVTGKLYGENTRETATALNNAAMTLSMLKRYAEALPLMERAYALRRELLGEDDPATAKLRERVLLFREKASK